MLLEIVNPGELQGYGMLSGGTTIEAVAVLEEKGFRDCGYRSYESLREKNHQKCNRIMKYSDNIAFIFNCEMRHIQL